MARLAEQQRRLGAEPQARTLEYCADALWSVLRANDDELLTLRRPPENPATHRIPAAD